MMVSFDLFPNKFFLKMSDLICLAKLHIILAVKFGKIFKSFCTNLKITSIQCSISFKLFEADFLMNLIFFN
jgi:hypothetical protein